MQYEWDEAKRCNNMLKHGEDFADVAMCFDWHTANIVPDTRYDYAERRVVAYGPRFDGRVMVLTFTMRQGEILRIISYRKANTRERMRYAKIF